LFRIERPTPSLTAIEGNLFVAVIFHIALGYTRYGKFTYAIGANPQAARVSGINIGSHLIKVYAIAGLLSGLAGVVTAARAKSGSDLTRGRRLLCPLWLSTVPHRRSKP